MLTRRARTAGDDGAILILAMLFIGVIGLLVLALMSTSTSVVAGTGGKRDLLAKRAAADAGLQYGLQQVRARTQLCPSAAADGLLNPPADFISGVLGGVDKEIQVRVSCEILVDSLIGSSGYALVTRDTTLENAATAGANGVQLPVSGPVYLSGNPGTAAFTSQGDLAFKMSNGDVVMRPQGGHCPPLPDRMTLAGAPFGFACSPTAPLAPANILPSAVSGDSRTLAPSFTPAANCGVFLPGKYDFGATNPTPKLSVLEQNYFVSGVYYFNNVILDLTKSTLVGGRSTSDEIAEDDNGGNPLVTPCSSDANAKTATGYDSGGSTGVKIILGGKSQMLTDNPKGHLELFARQGGDSSVEGLQGVSLVTVQSTAGGFIKSSLGLGDVAVRAGKPNGGGGSTLTFVVHGFVYTPNARIQVRINDIPARFFAGIDTGQLLIGTSNNVSGFSISVTSKPIIRKFKLTAVACGQASVDNCTGAYDGGQNLLATAVVSVNSKTRAMSVETYHVGPD